MSKTTLHLIFSIEGWQKADPLIENTDQLLFLQDATYLLQTKLEIQTADIYARDIDVQARNIKPLTNIMVIDDAKWVELTNSAHNVISW